MVVDNEPNVLRLIAQALSRVGFEVKTVTSVVQALDYMGWRESPEGSLTWRPDLILSNRRMGGYNGLEFLYIVRSEAVFRGVPFILMAEEVNALYNVQGFLKSLAQQPDAFLFKPFSVDEMNATLNRFLSDVTQET